LEAIVSKQTKLTHKILPLKLKPILLAGNDQHGVLAAVRALRVAGYAPWLAIDKPGTYAGRSWANEGTVSVSDADSDSEGFARELAAAAVRLSVAAVLPSSDSHFLALAGREADFPGIALGTPSRESVDRATDKTLLPELAASAGLRTPPTARVTPGGGSEVVGAFGFPAVVKPLRSRVQNPDGTISNYSAHVVSADQVEDVLDDLDGESLVQPYIPGVLISISGVSWEGELVCALHQASVRIWPVPVGGSAYAETIPPNVKLEQGVSRLLEMLGWSGLFQIQFIRSSRGEHFLIDFNPRIYGTLVLAVAAGLNLPGIWVDLLLGRRPEVDSYRVGVRYRHEEKDARALAWQLLKGGGRKRAIGGMLPRRRTAHAIFSLRDPMPLLTSAAKLNKLTKWKK
jgi:predicted ATP-grasp superfamily ATP-dependent carboligase